MGNAGRVQITDKGGFFTERDGALWLKWLQGDLLLLREQ